MYGRMIKMRSASMTKPMKKSIARVSLAAIVCFIGNAAAAQPSSIITIDRLIDHTSTVPAIAGQKINLFVREKIAADLLEKGSGKTFERKVVLMVHGGFSPSTVAFDYRIGTISGWRGWRGRASTFSPWT